MDIAQVGIDALHSLTIQHGLQTQHAMGSGVLRTDVNHIVISAEKLILFALQNTILIKIELQTIVRLYIVLQRVLIVELPILTDRLALKITAKEQTTHIGMAQEYDTIEVINLTFQQISHTPNV